MYSSGGVPFTTSRAGPAPVSSCVRPGFVQLGVKAGSANPRPAGLLRLGALAILSGMNLIEQLRAKIVQDQFEFSQHATDQSILRQISVAEIREVFAAGEVIEDYPQDKYGPSCLVLGFTKAGRPLHVQCSYPSRPLLKIITVYEPDPSLWIEYRRRRS
jgi:hypothetical protein